MCSLMEGAIPLDGPRRIVIRRKGFAQVIVDTSVIIAILRDEPDAAVIGEALARPGVRRMSAVSYVEAGIVVDSNRNPVLSRRLDDLLRDVEIAVEPVT